MANLYDHLRRSTLRSLYADGGDVEDDLLDPSRIHVVDQSGRSLLARKPAAAPVVETPPPRFQDPVSDFLGRRAAQLASGWHGLWDPSGTTAADPAWWEQKAQGASDVLRGAAPFVAPLGAPALAAAPLSTLAGLGAGMAAGTGIEAAARKAGVPPGQAALAGDVTGIASGLVSPQVTEGGFATPADPSVQESGPTLFHTIADNLDNAASAAMDRMRQRGSFTGTRAAALPVDDATDLAIWGASKMARGVSNFDDWSKEMLGEFPGYENVQANLPKIYAAAQKKYDAHMVKAADQFPNTQQVLDLYHQGKSGADWYDKTWDELKGYFGNDAERFIDFLSATSPNNTVPGNVTEALKAYMQWKNGQPFQGFMPVKIDMMNQAVAGEPFGGLKVSSFKKNLMGDPLPVTIDRWMARAFGFGDKVTPAQYKFLDYVVTQAAQAKGIEPRQMQAAIWAAAREAAGANTTGSSFETVLRNRLLKDPDLAATIKRVSGAPLPSAGTP